MTQAATTAKPAPSVAVTKPPKIPPNIIRGRTNAKDASFPVLFKFDKLKVSSIGSFFLIA